MPKIAYRFEVSGGFSGNAYRYESLLLGSLEELHRELLGFFQDGSNASSMVSWEFVCIVESLKDANLVQRVDLRPALVLMGGGHTWTFSGDGGFVLDGTPLDHEGWQNNINIAAQCFDLGARVTIDWDRLDLSILKGTPLADGEVWSVVNRAGVNHDQTAGQWVGDFFEAHAFAP